MKRIIASSLVLLLCLQQFALGGISVFLDFNSDWVTELNQATTAAGVSNFSTGERTTIESNIKSHLESIWSDYNVTFSTTDPGGKFETINFGADLGSGILGSAALDPGNLFTDDLSVNVSPGNFGFMIETGDSRADQISEISLGLSGTAAHELGHGVGLHHHHAYSDPGITPATYGDTGGLQNDYVIATGSTGLNEAGRESLRGFSPFEKAMLDIAGGASTVFFGQDNESLVTSGITSDNSENTGSDAGATIGTAQLLTTNVGHTSKLDIAWVEADLDNSTSDVDVFKFTTVNDNARLLAHVYSSLLLYGSGAEFDAMLELLDSTGTVIASNDDVHYDGNTYDSGSFRTLDAFLNNITLTTAGDYYLRVTPVSGAEVGSNYWLVAAIHDAISDTAIPEPGSLALLMTAGVVFWGARRWRRRR